MSAGKITAVIALTGIMVLSSLITFAGPPPPPPPQTTGPIDSGVLVLLIGAAVFGYRQLNRSNQKEV